MARRYVNPHRPAPPVASLGGTAVAELVAWTERTYPGSSVRDVIANYERLTAAAAAPGAKLDGFPWARSWGTFLKAAEHDMDARAVIADAARALFVNASGGMTERIPSEGGYLLPEYLRGQVTLYVEESLVRPRALVIPMTSLRLQLPVVDNTSEASSAGVLGGMTFTVVTEGKMIPASTAGFSRVTLRPASWPACCRRFPTSWLTTAAPRSTRSWARRSARAWRGPRTTCS